MPRSLSAIVLAGGLLSACHRPTPGDLLDHMKVDERQKARALDVVNNLREAFNGGSCQPIYIDAAGYFKAEELEDWLADCRSLKNELGSWRSFELKSVARCGKPEFVVCLTGSAEFEKQRTEVRIAVQLNAGGDQLHSLSIQDGERHWTGAPHWSSPGRSPLGDPPRKKSPKDGLAS
jgi:hypothetical protein